MAYIEQFLPPIQSDGLNTQENASFEGTFALSGAFASSTSATLLKKPIAVDSTNGTSPTLTSAQSNSLVLLDAASGSNVRLPVPVKGMVFDFVIVTAATTGSHGIVTDAGTTFLLGSAFSTGTGPSAAGVSTVATFAANGSTTVAMRLGQTSNASAGTYVRFEALSSTLWLVSGHMVSGTSPSTVSPFKAG